MYDISKIKKFLAGRKGTFRKIQKSNKADQALDKLNIFDKIY